MTPILSTDELSRLLASSTDLALLDARASGYDEGHLRGAQRADLETQLSAARDEGANPARGGRHPLPPLDRWTWQLGAWGISPETHVVIYDDQSGANAAARAWWMLRAVGHERVSVLDGGLAAAIAAGFDTTPDIPKIAARPPYPAASWQRPTAGRSRVDALRNDANWKVLDVRSGERFRGETEPIDPIAGHIPGAVNLPFAQNLKNGRFKSPAELRTIYENLLGATPADRLIVHCGSGVTACHTLLALESAGLDGAALYVGSWGEWCRNQ
ncbi:MAG: sulfurtransferase [Acidobacteriota bacterium]|nr:sulfurtransferase [Acidobacteriota bacterium]